MAPAPSSAGDWDDYDTTIAGDIAFITGFQFIGGVPESDDNMRFTWGVYLPPSTTFASRTRIPLLSTSAPLGLYGVGNFGWTFTITGVVSIPDTGLMGGLAYFQIDGPTVADDVVWFRTGTGALSVGNNDFCVGSSNDGCTKVQRFAFWSPDPATISLLAVGTLLSARRKR